MSDSVSDGVKYEALVVYFTDKLLKEFAFENQQLSSPRKSDKPYVIIPSDDLLNSFKIQYMAYFNRVLAHMEQLLHIKIKELFL